MKRDMDLVREILLFFENKEGTAYVPHANLAVAEADEGIRAYHIRLMYDGGLLVGEPITSETGRIIDVLPFELTWQGHELLDAIRDPEVWRRTKDGARKVGGLGVSVLVSLATAFGKQLVKEKLGLEI